MPDSRSPGIVGSRHHLRLFPIPVVIFVDAPLDLIGDQYDGAILYDHVFDGFPVLGDYWNVLPSVISEHGRHCVYGVYQFGWVEWWLVCITVM